MTQPLPKTYAELRWWDDMDPAAAETASDLESLEQDVYHLLVEALGSNLDDPNRGAGVIDLLGADATKLSGYGAIVDAQLEEDTRIDAATTTIGQLPDGSWQVSVEVAVDGAVLSLNYKLGPGGLSRG